MVVHGPYPPDTRVAREAKAALEGGFEVDVVATQQPGQPPAEIIDGVRVIRLPRSHKHGLSFGSAIFEYGSFTLLATAKVAKLALKRRYSIIQVHNPPDFLIAAAIMPRLLGARIVLDVHDLAPDMFASRFGEGRLTRAALGILRVIERLAASSADVVLTVHEPYRRELARRGVRNEKLQIVMNSLDESLLPVPLTRKYEGGFRIVYHGTVTPHYGVHLLVEAVAMIARQVPEARLEIYGEGDAVRGLQASARERDLQNVINFEPRFMPQRDVLARIQHAAVGVVPNLPIQLNRYALSSKLFEYVMLGIPVVSADLPTLREHFADDEVMFFRAGDAHALADALLRVATDPSGARRRAEAARRRYEDYRWSRSAARYRELLERLSGSASS